jgi:methyltransferase (TIGR00027 family)
MPIAHISDTARWVATYRAMESERPDAIFHDPFARRLAGARGEAIVNELPSGRAMAWAMIVRTAVFDEVILDRIGNHGVDLVINLAAGLDARPWRLDLPAALHWVDIDLPDILTYKHQILADAEPRCHYRTVTADLTNVAERGATLQRVGAGHSRVLAVAEGLLIYLASEQVAALARDLHAVPGLRWWLLDLASPELLRIILRRWRRAADPSVTQFQFAPAEGSAFFRPMGWREAQFRSTVVEARRLRREMRGSWFWRLVARLSSPQRQEAMRRMSGYLLLERADA